MHEALRPTVEEIEFARRIVAAAEASPGAARLDGRLIDIPIVLRARALLEREGH